MEKNHYLSFAHSLHFRQILPIPLRHEPLIEIVKIFIQVINGIISRYDSILELKIKNAYRFGLQMRTLTADATVREQIFRYLCREGKDHVALTWIADEVTFWAMD